MTLTSPSRARRGPAALVDTLAGLLGGRSSRRSFLTRSAVVGSAIAVAPVDFLLKPGTAYASVCGLDSACSSGYTVFCATINNGVNRCPPGALVGGWWKADGSGFCCGSARYYIDCHSYCSCGCGGGTAFCGEGCRSCSCGCGPTSSCDQRLVCCNEFRYGQCNQSVPCTGPVWCRVVTCTPPWTVAAWDCTTTSATDPRTATHSAPGLPVCTAIDQHYTALGGPGSFLGQPVTGEVAVPGGARTDYDRGSVYWSPATGAHEVHGAIRDAWYAKGGASGPMGYPTSDEQVAPGGGGAYSLFSVGSISWRADLGAHVVWGAVRDRWLALGGLAGPLGWPTTDEQEVPGSPARYNDFTGPAGPGTLCWHPDLGAHPVWGEVRKEWVARGGVRGPLGVPSSDEAASRDGAGVVQTFAGPAGPASVHWSPATGAHAVWGAVRERYLALGGEDGLTGRPTGDEYDAPAAAGRQPGRGQDFVGSGTAAAPAVTIAWSPPTGAHSVRSPVREAWVQAGGTRGRLGFPTSEPRPVGAGRVRSDFQGGYAVADLQTGRVSITYT